MSGTNARRSRVVLHGGAGAGMNPGDRATLTRLLLERGLEVSCRQNAPAMPGYQASGGDTVVVGNYGGSVAPAPAPGVRVVDASGVDPALLAATVDRTIELTTEPTTEPGSGPRAGGAAAPWKPWFPVIDYSRCTNCMQCLSFCLFDVYGVSADSKIQVQHQSNCKTDCPACSRVCPEVAIMFPKYRHGPINGEEITADDVRREAMKVDISALLGGDIYAMLRDRSVKAKSRFSKERDDERALKERQTCLIALQRDLDVPAEVLAALPSAEEILAKAEAARLRAQAASQAAANAEMKRA
jgi:NAD-dependent dihydropyrimidine dehydrogenase PreA subunit